jgi:type I restriction enzyme S subunit
MIIPNKSVIITCIGSDMGKVMINKNDCLANQQINSLIVGNDFDTDFVYYKLKDSYQILRSRADGGSTMPILNKTQFE